MEILNTILNSKLQNRLLRTLVLFLLCAGFAFPFPMSPAIAEKSPNEILAGVHRNFPPQYSIDEKTGKPTGFAIDTMDEIARRAGLKVRYILFDEWPPIMKALKEGRIDIIPNMGIVEERKADYDVTSPLEACDIRIFVRETTTDIHSIDDLRGQKVAVVSDNKGLFIIQEYGKAKPVIFKSLDEALLSLLSGNTDALVYPGLPVLFITRKSQLSERIKIVGNPLFEVKRAIAVGKGKTDLLNKLDTAVKEFIPTQEYKKIYARWYGAPEPYWNARRVLILAGIILVLIIVIFTGWHYLSLIRLNRDLKCTLEEQNKAEEALLKSEETAKRLAQENDLMAEIGRIISSTLNIDEVYERFAEKVREIIPFDIITINIVNTKDNTRTIRYTSGMHITNRKIGDVAPIGGSVTERIVRTRSSLLINAKDNEGLSRQFPGILHTITAKIQSMMGIPLVSKDEIIGTLLLRSLKPDAYTERELRLAERVGSQIAGAIANAQLFLDRKRMEEEIREMSLRDQMTELYNRRGFITLVEQQIRAANRARRAMLLIFIDLDGLKGINDTMGHEEGDQVLIDAANVLRQTFRESDVIARLGGDEFAVLSIDATDMNPEDFSKRLQENIDAGNAKETRPYQLAMSWGTAVYNPESPVSFDELMSQADMLMYTHKRIKASKQS